MQRTPPRRGTVLVLVLGIILVLGAFALTVRVLSQHAYREVDAVSQHLRAVAVGEAAYATVISRLAATPWAARWFRDGPDVQRDVPAVDGTYSYLLRDAPPGATVPARMASLTSPSTHQADLLVRAQYGKSAVLLYWRLILPAQSLETALRVLPVFFTFAPDGQPTPAKADDITRQIQDQIKDRDDNSKTFDPLRGPLADAGTAGDIARVLGHDPPRPVEERVPGPDGTPGVPSADRRRADRDAGPAPDLPPGAAPSVQPPPPPATGPFSTAAAGGGAGGMTASPPAGLLPATPGGVRPGLMKWTILKGNLQGEIFYAPLAPAGRGAEAQALIAKGRAAVERLDAEFGGQVEDPLTGPQQAAIANAESLLVEFAYLQKFPR